MQSKGESWKKLGALEVNNQSISNYQTNSNNILNRNRQEQETSELPNTALQLDMNVNTSISIMQQDGNQVMNFLESGNMIDQVYGDFEQRKATAAKDIDFERPQVTKYSLVQDGLDIVNYLRLNRYTDDLESDQHSYDVHSIVQEFEDAVQELKKDISRLQSAVYRLNLLRTHLQKK